MGRIARERQLQQDAATVSACFLKVCLYEMKKAAVLASFARIQ
jgi:hypothetical protein